jgi:hypothetical protein
MKPISADTIRHIKDLKAQSLGLRVIAKQVGVGYGTVQRVLSQGDPILGDPMLGDPMLGDPMPPEQQTQKPSKAIETLILGESDMNANQEQRVKMMFAKGKPSRLIARKLGVRREEIDSFLATLQESETQSPSISCDDSAPTQDSGEVNDEVIQQIRRIGTELAKIYAGSSIDFYEWLQVRNLDDIYNRFRQDEVKIMLNALRDAIRQRKLNDLAADILQAYKVVQVA